ncbi:MAG: DUF5110 domain-containing protein [Bacteroidales bacterium]|nr:DUF5110 domain-containing protein [Bacteroidales bacterium]
MKKILISAAILCMAISASAQSSFMVDEGIAAFYPKNFQAEKLLPSAIFERELSPKGDVPSSWRIKPEYSEVGGKAVVKIAIGADDDIYGTGEVVGDLRRNGKEVIFWNSDNYGYMKNGGKSLYQSHPWVLGLRKDGTAYGIIADNTWKSSLKAEDGMLTFTSEGPQFRVVVIEKENSKEVLKALAKLSGTMELPPMWAIGYQQCRYSYYPDRRVMEIVDSLRLKNIPCDVVWMDIDYMDQFKVFTYDPKTFSQPKKLQDYIHARNMKTVYMIDPGIKVEDGYFVYDQGKAGDYFIRKPDGSLFTGRVWPGQCAFPDYTRHEVRSWWRGLTRDFMLKGADGIWNDMKEPSVFDVRSGTMDEDAVHLGGDGFMEDSHLRYHNIYGMNMVKASREGSLLAYPDKRPFVLSRDNFLGGQKYGATWTGDNMACWEHLQMSIPMTLNLGLSGQPFNGPDMGGFGADTDAELLAHWYATGVYFPFVRNHAAKGTIDQEPWVFGERIEAICRTAVNRRYMLLPYIYTLFREASTSGMPVMRPLFMADEKDTSLRAEQRVYMLGDDLMIIPRWATDPVLPKGDWDIIPFESKDDMYQAFVAQRAGSIVPTANLYQNTEEYRTDSLTLWVNTLDGVASGVMYEDGKDGFEYRKGEYAQYEFSATTDKKGNITVTMTQTAGQKDYGKKTLRVAVVADGKVTYSAWTQGDTVTVKGPKEKEFTLDPTKLVFSDIDISAQPSLREKLAHQTQKMEKTGQAFEW